MQLIRQNSQNYLLLLGTKYLPKHFNYRSNMLKTKITFSLSHSLFFFPKEEKNYVKTQQSYM